MAQQIIFFILAAIIAIFSIMAVTSKRIIRSAVYLLFVLLSTAGLYLLLNYTYLAAVQVAVYAGGIMVLFIFAILLTNRPGEKQGQQLNIRKSAAALAATGGLAFCAHVVYYNINRVAQIADQADLTPVKLGETLLGTGKYQFLLPFEVISVLLLACIVGAIMIARKR